ncbi:MAG: phosphatase PAP2 family protein [Bacteroidia bacterium]|nr:phosphatase PAP2 family protein [Bacteroidia bacterium]NNK89518.1 inositol phosphorylceramide synthase [Saprospiraceae bacterium]
MTDQPEFKRFGRGWLIAAALFTLFYWLWFGLIVGLDNPTIIFYFVIVLLFFINYRTRILAIGFFPFFIYLFCYSSLKVLHYYNKFPIHIEDLYLLELKLFGIHSEGIRMTLCEYFNNHQSLLFDVISGAFYITWAPFPIIFGLILFFSKKEKLLFDFWLCFLIANILGFIGYIVFPAAPPWYYLEFGNQFAIDAGNSAAGLSRFDQLIGVPIYQNMYAQGTNTFGAMPSMHAAFPMILVYYSMKFGNKYLTSLFIVSMVSIWFGAVYSNHHYVLDVLAGMLCAILGLIITESIVNRKFALQWYDKIISYIC